MTFDDVLKDIQKLANKPLKEISGGTLTVKNVDRSNERVELTDGGTRSFTELRTIFEALREEPAVHVDSVLMGSGSKRHQPETLFANLPYVEHGKIDSRKHIAHVGKSTHALGTLKDLSAADIARIKRGLFAGTTPFEADSIKQEAEKPPRELVLSEDRYQAVAAAIDSGKHLILTGPPGTGKTTLAEAVADAATRARWCDGHVLTTATADWTTYETIGGLRPSGPTDLRFEPGHFLKAIAGNQWLVIDELNRANFDRAFGQLFTVLSGQAVVLPYEDFTSQKPIALVPPHVTVPSGTTAIGIPERWRVIGTMNVFDKALLFEMSFALMRRFAFVEIPAPDQPTLEQLIEGASGGSVAAADLSKALTALQEIKTLGPVVYMDIARYAERRFSSPNVASKDVAFEAFYSFLLPQFEGIDWLAAQKLFAKLKPLVPDEDKLATTLEDVLGVAINREDGSSEEALTTEAE